MGWAFQFAPREDELLSGYLCRLARAHGASPYGFCELQLGDGAFWARDFDRGNITRHDENLASRAGITVERLRATTLRDWVSRLTPARYGLSHPSAITPWVNAAGVFHRTRSLHALQFCPDCLGETQTIYRKWRLAFVVMCPVHLRPLLDACPSCDAPFIPHRALGRLDLCHECRASLLRTVPASPFSLETYGSLLSVQGALLSLLGEGHYSRTPLCGADLIGLRAVLSVFFARASAAQAARLGGVIGDDAEAVGPRIELARHRRRVRVMAACARMLEGWPHSFKMMADQLGMTQRRFEPYAGQSLWLDAAKATLPPGTQRKPLLRRRRDCSRLDRLDVERPANWRATRAAALLRAAYRLS